MGGVEGERGWPRGRGGRVLGGEGLCPPLSLSLIHSFSSLLQTVVKRLNCLRARARLAAADEPRATQIDILIQGRGERRG